MPAKRKPPFDFKKFLSDRTTYPDELTLTLPEGGEITLADLREYDTQSQGAFGQELERQRMELSQRETQLQEATNRVATMYADVQRQQEAIRGTPIQSANPAADPLDPYLKDEVFRPVVSYLREVDNRYKGLEKSIMEKLDAQTRAIAQMGTTYMGDRAQQDWNSIQSRQEPEEIRATVKDLNLDRLYKYAVEQRIYDRNNLPNIGEAYDRLTASARHAYELKQAEQRGREAALTEQSEGAMLPRPVGGGLPQLPEHAVRAKNIGDAFGQASRDRDLWKQVNSALPIMGGSIQ